MTKTMRLWMNCEHGVRTSLLKSLGWKALAPPVLGWHPVGVANRERSNRRDFYSSACSDLLRGGLGI